MVSMAAPDVPSTLSIDARCFSPYECVWLSVSEQRSWSP
jgi:hypothetical protein